MCSKENPVTPPIVPRNYLLTYVLVTLLFSLWGFANDITNPMVAAFKRILLISNFESSLVQFAFYGGYCFMAFPAAIFIKRYTYKKGILLGLALYATGCLLFIPSGWITAFWAFLLAYFIMTCGLSFLETSSNPYILAMGDERTATRRLNFSQAFNPVGSIMGMLVAQQLILARMSGSPEEERFALQQSDPTAFQQLQQHDLGIVIVPYAILGAVVLAMFVVFLAIRLRKTPGEDNRELALGTSFRRLLTLPRYVEGVIAQAFYVGVQIMCWTFIIQYGVYEVGLPADVAQGYNIVAMIIFILSRFICTFLLQYITPGHLLMWLAIAGGVLILGLISMGGMTGLYCLVGVSACMSLMFPTIYGIALEGLGDDAKLGAAGLIFAIGGGCLMPPLQGAIMDMDAISIGGYSLPSVRASFILPFICFIVVATYGYRTFKIHKPKSETSQSA
ncbi:MAG: L-fucose:H+ symporter permease [Verrucomicrobiota bacterium JB024]|nr:L-fucose:H+ symporter permease [Verrucomicrobiota bacterium JB024]